MAGHQQKENPKDGARRFATLYITLNAAALLLSLLMLFGGSLPFLPLFSVCPLHAMGLYCPTCGMTRAVRALLHLDMAGALRYNPCVFFLLPCAVYYEAVGLVALIKRRGEPRGVSRLPLALLVVSLLVFFLARNILLGAFSIDPTGDFL